MPRPTRLFVPDTCYHVLNRGNSQKRVFHQHADFEHFFRLIGEAGQKFPMRILAFCLMPNHFHLVVWLPEGADLSLWMKDLQAAYATYHHRRYTTSGHLWQGRFKVFPIQNDKHLLTMFRYVEANAALAGIVPLAENWAYSSAFARPGLKVDPGPIPRFANWLDFINSSDAHKDAEKIRRHVARNAPYGDRSWAKRTATERGLVTVENRLGRRHSEQLPMDRSSL